MKPLPKPKKQKTISQVKKEVWTLFSKYIRLRDCIRTTGTLTAGICITCGRHYEFGALQAGHFIAGRTNGTLFSEKGVHAQCIGCNMFKGGLPLEYRRQIIKLYGDGYDEILENEAKVIKKYTIPELLQLKQELEKKIKVLEG